MLYMYIVGDTNSSLVVTCLLLSRVGQCRTIEGIDYASLLLGVQYLENSCQIRLAHGRYCICHHYQNSVNYNKNCKNI